MSEKVLIKNRKAFHEYEVLERFEAGMHLKGTEIKSLREGGGSLQEAYIRVMGAEIFLLGACIMPYRYGNIHNHEERRDRKLLMHKKEIFRLEASVKEKGLTLIPLSLYLKKGRAKLEVALVRGKKLHDKRESLKTKEAKRQIDRQMKNL